MFFKLQNNKDKREEKKKKKKKQTSFEALEWVRRVNIFAVEATLFLHAKPFVIQIVDHIPEVSFKRIHHSRDDWRGHISEHCKFQKKRYRNKESPSKSRRNRKRAGALTSPGDSLEKGIPLDVRGTVQRAKPLLLVLVQKFTNEILASA